MGSIRGKTAAILAGVALLVGAGTASATPQYQSGHDDGTIVSYEVSYSPDGIADLDVQGIASIFFSDVSNMMIEKTVTLFGQDENPPPPAVPEPATSLLMGLGLLSVAIYGKRRKNS